MHWLFRCRPSWPKLNNQKPIYSFYPVSGTDVPVVGEICCFHSVSRSTSAPVQHGWHNERLLKSSYGAKADASAVTHLLSQAIATSCCCHPLLGCPDLPTQSLPSLFFATFDQLLLDVVHHGGFPSFRLLMACRTYWRMTCRSRPHAGTLNRRVVWVTKKCVRLERLAQTHTREHRGSRTSSRPSVLVAWRHQLRVGWGMQRSSLQVSIKTVISRGLDLLPPLPSLHIPSRTTMPSSSSALIPAAASNQEQAEQTGRMWEWGVGWVGIQDLIKH